MHIEESDASGRDSRIDHKGEHGKGALTAEVYAFEIDIHGWRVWDWRCVAEDESVDQITDLLRRIDDPILMFLILNLDIMEKLRERILADGGLQYAEGVNAIYHMLRISRHQGPKSRS